MEGIDPNSCARPVLEKKARPQEQLNCPRCNSTNTKFCYYNNYSLTQPRYFCKTCRRYWTEGGSLRNVPVGGGSRKNKKVTSASSSSSTIASSKVPDLNPKMQGGQDLNLAFQATMENYHGVPKFQNGETSHQSCSSSAPTSLSALELLRSGLPSRGLMSPYAPSLMTNSNSLYPPSGCPMQEVKPNPGFSVDWLGNRSYGVQENGGRLLFTFGDVKQQLSAGAAEAEHNKEPENSTGYWTGMIGGGSW